MDDRLSKLAKVAAASMRGAPVDAKWIYDESLALIQDRETFQTNALWHTLVDCARALNDVGEFALGGEIFELLLTHSRERRYPKIEFDALEGLGQSWFYLGDKDRAFQYLNTGLELAIRLKKRTAEAKFQDAIANYLSEKPAFPPGEIRAPVEGLTGKPKRRALISTLLKKERNRP
jgi:hypothetical protein